MVGAFEDISSKKLRKARIKRTCWISLRSTFEVSALLLRKIETNFLIPFLVPPL